MEATGDNDQFERYRDEGLNTKPSPRSGVAKYQTHARLGRIGGLVIGLVAGGSVSLAFAAPMLGLVTAIGAAMATYLGSIYPDIDRRNSIPRRKATRLVQPLALFTVIGFGVVRWEQWVGLITQLPIQTSYLGIDIPVALIAGIGILLLGFGALAGTDLLIGLLTARHRTWTHSLRVNFVLTLGAAGGVSFLASDLALPIRVAIVFPVIAFFLGTLIHLGLDDELP